RWRIHMPGGEPPLLHTHPAIALLAAIFLKIGLAVVTFAKARHARELLRDRFEEMQQRLSPVGQVHLRTDPRVDIKILAKRTERITHIRLPRVPRARYNSTINVVRCSMINVRCSKLPPSNIEHLISNIQRRTCFSRATPDYCSHAQTRLRPGR